MIELNNVNSELFQNIRIIFTDIDDTLTLNGKLPKESYNALWELYEHNIIVIPITGRCAGWVDHIARMWPVKGVIGENGAFYAYMDKNESPSKLKKRYILEPIEIMKYKEKFQKIKMEVFLKFPQCKVASDQPYREFDLAIDYCEDVPALSKSEVQEIVEIYEKYGATVKVSSIHVNGWFGNYDKLKMTKIFAKEIMGLDLNSKEIQKQSIFIGDSPNDEPMFKFFVNSIGVNNIKKFLPEMNHHPKYVTNESGGIGFAEFASKVLNSKIHYFT